MQREADGLERTSEIEVTGRIFWEDGLQHMHQFIYTSDFYGSS